MHQQGYGRGPPGSAGVPPAHDLAICNEPCKSGSATPPNRETVNGSLLTATRLRARPTRERGRPARIRPGNLQRTLQKRVRHPSQTRNREREPPYSTKATSETPPGSAGVPPAYDLAIRNEPCKGRSAAPRKRETVNGSLLTPTRLRARPHPGARASRPHSTWQ